MRITITLTLNEADDMAEAGGLLKDVAADVARGKVLRNADGEFTGVALPDGRGNIDEVAEMWSFGTEVCEGEIVFEEDVEL